MVFRYRSTSSGSRSGPVTCLLTLRVRQNPREPFFIERRRSLPPEDPRTIFVAIEQDLGLRLEPSTEKLDVFVIERVERPSPN